MFSHANLLHCATNLANGFQWRSDDRLLHHFPLYHVNGAVTHMAPTFLRGSAVYLVRRFSVSEFARQLKWSAAMVTFVCVSGTRPSAGRLTACDLGTLPRHASSSIAEQRTLIPPLGA